MLLPLVVLLALSLPAALADTPANCSYEEIVGTWLFHIGEKGFDNTVHCLDTFQVES